MWSTCCRFLQEKRKYDIIVESWENRCIRNSFGNTIPPPSPHHPPPHRKSDTPIPPVKWLSPFTRVPSFLLLCCQKIGKQLEKMFNTYSYSRFCYNLYYNGGCGWGGGERGWISYRYFYKTCKVIFCKKICISVPLN